MATYIFTPTKTVHPTVAESQLLLRHVKHDLPLTTQAITFAFRDMVKEGDEQARGEIEKKGLDGVGHLNHIMGAPAQFMQRDVPPGIERELVPPPTCTALYTDLQTELKRRHPRQVIEVAVQSDAPVRNLYEVIYMQMYNFAQNAVGASRIGKNPIVISAEQVTLDDLTVLGKNQDLYTRNSPFFRAYVSDQGEGIPAADLVKLFAPRDPFARKGVGNSLADWTCDRIHGFIKVESEVGKGSTFSLYFPQERKS